MFTDHIYIAVFSELVFFTLVVSMTLEFLFDYINIKKKEIVLEFWISMASTEANARVEFIAPL